MAFISRGFITTHNQSAVGAASQHLSSRRCRRGHAPPPPAELGSESLGLKDEAGGLSCPRMVFPLGGGSQEGLGSE